MTHSHIELKLVGASQRVADEIQRMISDESVEIQIGGLKLKGKVQEVRTQFPRPMSVMGQLIPCLDRRKECTLVMKCSDVRVNKKVSVIGACVGACSVARNAGWPDHGMQPTDYDNFSLVFVGVEGHCNISDLIILVDKQFEGTGMKVLGVKMDVNIDRSMVSERATLEIGRS